MSEPEDMTSAFDDHRRYIGGLKSTSMTVSGYFDSGAASAFYAALPPDEGVRVTYSLPANRWQGFKARHAGARWMRWLVRLRPVRWHAQVAFTGQMEIDDDGSITVTQAQTVDGGVS